MYQPTPPPLHSQTDWHTRQECSKGDCEPTHITDAFPAGHGHFSMRSGTYFLAAEHSAFRRGLLTTLHHPQCVTPDCLSSFAAHSTPDVDALHVFLSCANSSQSKDISLEERAILMAESAFQQWLAVSGYCAARPFAWLPSLIVLESVASFVTYS